MKISESCAPMEKTGLSPSSESWNTIAIPMPRTLRSSDFGAADDVEAVEVMLPRTTPGSSTRPSSERLSTVFPDPLAPTMATASPMPTANDTPRTALTTPSRVSKSISTSATRSNAVIFLPASAGGFYG